MKLLFSLILMGFAFSFAGFAFDYTKMTYSQVGYDCQLPKHAMIQHVDSSFLSNQASFKLKRLSDDKVIVAGRVGLYYKKWSKFFWNVDFSACQKAGEYYLVILDHGQVIYQTSKDLPIHIDSNLLWNKTWYLTALWHLNIRDSLSYKPEGGWKDCGSPLQEVSSHVIMVNALCDLLELNSDLLSAHNKQEIMHHLVVGSEYITLCQDKATELGYQEGAVVHEVRENLKVVTGNVAKTAMILARVSRLIKDQNPVKAIEYKQRAIKSYQWITKYGPVLHWEQTDNFAITHGAPYGMYKPPKEFMTRDLLMLMWASLELYKGGELAYKDHAVSYALKIGKRQVPNGRAEDGLYGHFYTYDSYDFTEKANIHCGAWNANYKAYNQGGHFPHYIIPLIEMTHLWPYHPDVNLWQKIVYDFAYHYFLPATNQNPFKILPAGYYQGQGLLNWSGWYHGHNKIFGYAAGLAMEFYHLYRDPAFMEVALGNLQWITGLHSGFFTNNPEFSASMIVGVGNVSKADWDAMNGTITNGFESFSQFSLTKPNKDTDLPLVFGDEGGIHHTAGWISGLTRLMKYK